MSCLVVVNTRGRVDMRGRIIGRILACRSKATHLLVVDDASPDKHDLFFLPCPVHFLKPRHGPGMARRAALVDFLKTRHTWLLCLDCDMFVRPGFDTEPIRMQLPQSTVLTSPYRTDIAEHTQHEVALFNGLWGPTFPGCALMFSRWQAEVVLINMPSTQWNGRWDWNLAQYMDGCFRPWRSLAMHAGTDHESVHAGQKCSGVGFGHALQPGILPMG